MKRLLLVDSNLAVSAAIMAALSHEAEVVRCTPGDLKPAPATPLDVPVPIDPMRREIAAHNAAVDAKRLARQQRRDASRTEAFNERNSR
jgi:hypothetical protein